MTAEADRSWQEAEASRYRERLRRGLKATYVRLRRAARWLPQHLPFRHGFSSLTRRIVILNLIGLPILVSGILYLNQFRAGLIDAKVQSLLTQGEIIARAIAASAGVDTDEVQLDPEKLLESEQGQAETTTRSTTRSNSPSTPSAPPRSLRRLVKPTGSRARIYNRDGALILDSDTFYSRGEVLRYDLPPPDAEKPRRAHLVLAGGEDAHATIRSAALYRDRRRQRQGLSRSGDRAHRHLGADRPRQRQGRARGERRRADPAHARRARRAACFRRAAATSTISSLPSAGASCACRCSPRPSPSCCR